MSESCRYDLNRPYACQTHNTQWLDDDADQCEYKRMVVAEAATSAVREACDQWHSLIGTIPISEVLRALDGERDE